MITKKENNINLRNMSAHLEEKERVIMKRKIEFLELQIAEGGKREANLRRENEQLKKSLDDLARDKQNVINMIDEGRDKQLEAIVSQQRRDHEQLQQRYIEQQSKLEQITSFLGEKYQQELLRVEELAEQRMQHVKEQSRTELVYYERKLKEYERTMEKYSKLCMSSVVPTNDRGLSSLMLDTSTSSFIGGSNFHTNRREDLNNSNSSIHLQSFSTIIPQANLSSSQLPEGLMKNSLKAYPHAKNEQSLLLSESDLETVQMGRHSAYVGEPRQSINRSKSIMLLDSGCTSKKKQKTIATSLFCTTCSKEYPPNEYYRHLKGCEDNARQIQDLLSKRERIQQQISKINHKQNTTELEDVVVVLKKRRDPPATSRVSMTSRPKLR